jgi:hypothetical protein
VNIILVAKTNLLERDSLEGREEEGNMLSKWKEIGFQGVNYIKVA